MGKKIIFATGNEHKMVEIRMILEDLGAEIFSQREAGIEAEVVEDGTTFEENALIKATEIGKAARKLSGFEDAVVLADDSGLEIDYLNKEPGIYSARYMGEDTSYDIVRGRFVYQNKVLELTKSEGKIMSTLLGQRGNWVTREQLMMTLWNTDEFVTDATLSVHISRLRNKLKELTNGKDIIKTKKGVGYYID